MKTKSVSLIAMLLLSVSLNAQPTCKVTYIANDGFLLETPHHKILTDALFGGFEGDWCDQPNDTNQLKLASAASPFDEVDIITISHRHDDHFNPEMVISHLISNPKCTLVCPKQVDSVLALSNKYSQIKNNVVAITPSLNHDTLITIDKIQLKIFRLEHGRFYEADEKTGEKINRHRNIENIGVLIQSDGIRMFHSGDAFAMNDEAFKHFDLSDEKIDIALLDRIFMYHVTAVGIQIIKEYIKPKNIILMHVTPGKSQQFRDVGTLVKEEIPNVFLFDKPMEKKTYHL